jgi:hypothetical protein
MAQPQFIFSSELHEQLDEAVEGTGYSADELLSEDAEPLQLGYVAKRGGKPQLTHGGSDATAFGEFYESLAMSWPAPAKLGQTPEGLTTVEIDLTQS